MQGAFATVIWVVCIGGVVLGLVSLALTSRTWEEYGKHALLMESDSAHTPRAGSSAALMERDEEIRQLLEARNRRRQRRGEASIDVEQELAKLTAPEIDAELREEIRVMVVARNHRRARTGKPPLDVETEIQREILELAPLR